MTIAYKSDVVVDKQKGKNRDSMPPVRKGRYIVDNAVAITAEECVLLDYSTQSPSLSNTITSYSTFLPRLETWSIKKKKKKKIDRSIDSTILICMHNKHKYLRRTSLSLSAFIELERKRNEPTERAIERASSDFELLSACLLFEKDFDGTHRLVPPHGKEKGKENKKEKKRKTNRKKNRNTKKSRIWTGTCS